MWIAAGRHGAGRRSHRHSARWPIAQWEAPVNNMTQMADMPIAEARPVPSAHETLLYVDGVTVTFDGFRALNNLSLYVTAGEMRAIIGPNGAGKTTMMDVITGKTKPDTGTVLFRGDLD